MEGEASVNIDYQKYNADKIWDGLKGYITNTLLSREEIIGQYSQLWQIEKAFRISKTDLRIRPVYHRLRNRIEAHICICFAAYTVYKELERLIIINQIRLSPEKAINEIKEIKQLSYTLPKSKETKTKILKPTNEQEWLLNLEI
ncbi:transposase [Cyclobacterium xiamenense]|uniref:IS1634 family transposase n=1 Tax=Cyclobacterium xiamenense TaxID=1297121 RepID=UPI0035CFB5F3